MIYDKHTAALIEVSISRGNSQSGILHHIPPPCSKLNIPCRNESRFQYMQRLHRTTGRKGFLQRLVLNSLPFCSFIPMVTSDLTICNVTLPTGLVKQETPEDQCKLDSCHSTPSTSRIEVKMKGRGEEKEYLIFMADTAGDSSLLPVLPKRSVLSVDFHWNSTCINGKCRLYLSVVFTVYVSDALHCNSCTDELVILRVLPSGQTPQMYGVDLISTWL